MDSHGGITPTLRDWFRRYQPNLILANVAGRLYSYEDNHSEGTSTSGGTGRGGGGGGGDTRMEILVPAFDSPARKLSVRAATILLATTVCADGEALWGTSEAMARTGMLTVAVGMFLGAILTERALYLLCACARHGGVISYGEVAWTAYGPKAEFVVAALLHLFVLRMIVFHLVAVRDLLYPAVVQAWFTATSVSGPPAWLGGNILLCGIILLLSPALIMRDIYSLRVMAFASFGCLMTVLMGLALAAFMTLIQQQQERGHNEPSLDTATPNTGYDKDTYEDEFSLFNFLLAFPATLLTFVSSFIIILSLHAPLRQPTNARVGRVIRQGVFLSWAVLVSFGCLFQILGQHYEVRKLLLVVPRSTIRLTGEQADDSVSWLFLIHRIFAALSILCSTSVILHPCRANILECIQRHLQSAHNHSHNPECGGCCCCDADQCQRMHENCPDECMKDEVETAEETIPSFTSQSITPRINNTAFLPIISGSPVVSRANSSDEAMPPPMSNVLVSSHMSGTSSEMTPLIPSGNDSSTAPSHVDDCFSQKEQKRVVFATGEGDEEEGYRSQQRAQWYGGMDNRQGDNKNENAYNYGEDDEANHIDMNNNAPHRCNIESNRVIRNTCGAAIMVLCLLVTVSTKSDLYFTRSQTGQYHSHAGATGFWDLAKTSVGLMVSFVLPVAVRGSIGTTIDCGKYQISFGEKKRSVHIDDADRHDVQMEGVTEPYKTKTTTSISKCTKRDEIEWQS
eukprot:scaffold2482_cov166-Amphora_coffeaeformis.AAC.15